MTRDEFLDDLRNAGDPAFPSNVSFPSGNEYWFSGMSLRDYFAGQALVGILAFPIPGPEKIFDRAARDAYVYADAMLEAREATKKASQ